MAKKCQADASRPSQEGYVAIDALGGDAVKLVDRMEFSYNNFSPDILKGWDKPSRN